MTAPKRIVRVKERSGGASSILQAGEAFALLVSPSRYTPKQGAQVESTNYATSEGVSVRHVSIAVLGVVLLLICVLWVYRGRGRHGQLLILLYLGSLVCTQASVTAVFRVCSDFHAPCLLTTFQLLMQSVVAHLFLQFSTKTKSRKTKEAKDAEVSGCNAGGCGQGRTVPAASAVGVCAAAATSPGGVGGHNTVREDDSVAIIARTITAPSSAHLASKSAALTTALSTPVGESSGVDDGAVTVVRKDAYSECMGVPALVAEVGGLGSWLKSFGPLAVLMSVSLLAHNASIMYIGLGLSTILSAFSPAVTTLFCALLGQRFPLTAWCGIAIVSVGGIVTVSGLHLEKADSRKSFGCALATLALVTRAAKVALQDLCLSMPLTDVKEILDICIGRFQTCLHRANCWSSAGSSPSSSREAAPTAGAVGASSMVTTSAAPRSPPVTVAPSASTAEAAHAPDESLGKCGKMATHASFPTAGTRGHQRIYEPLEIWALQSPLMCALCVVASLVTDGLEPWRTLVALCTSGAWRRVVDLAVAVAVSCALSCLLGLSSLASVKSFGATASQIVGKLNVLITATVAMIFLHENVGHSEFFGGFLLVAGAYVFERESHGHSKAAAFEESSESASLLKAPPQGAGATDYAACDGTATSETHCRG